MHTFHILYTLAAAAAVLTVCIFLFSLFCKQRQQAGFQFLINKMTQQGGYIHNAVCQNVFDFIRAEPAPSGWEKFGQSFSIFLK